MRSLFVLISLANYFVRQKVEMIPTFSRELFRQINLTNQNTLNFAINKTFFTFTMIDVLLFKNSRLLVRRGNRSSELTVYICALS